MQIFLSVNPLEHFKSEVLFFSQIRNHKIVCKSNQTGEKRNNINHWKYLINNKFFLLRLIFLLTRMMRKKKLMLTKINFDLMRQIFLSLYFFWHLSFTIGRFTCYKRWLLTKQEETYMRLHMAALNFNFC